MYWRLIIDEKAALNTQGFTDSMMVLYVFHHFGENVRIEPAVKELPAPESTKKEDY